MPKERSVDPIKRRAFAVFLCVFLLIPLIFSAPSHQQQRYGLFELPRIATGDEPHYLVMINSLLYDGDLNLANNYKLAEEGGTQAGLVFAGEKLDHHTLWYKNDQRQAWQKIWGMNPSPADWQRIEASTQREYPTHPLGLAVIIAVLLEPFRAWPNLVEPLAVLAVALSSVLLLLRFRKLAQRFMPQRQALLATGVLACATPIWHFSRALYGENILALLLLLCVNWLLDQRLILAGISLGLAVLIKPVAVLLAAPLLIYLGRDHLRTKKLLAKKALHLFSPIAICLGALLYANYSFWGSVWRSPQEFQVGDFWSGLTGLLFSPTKGLLGTAPIILLLLPFWPMTIKNHRAPGALALSIALIYVAIMSLWLDWQGGTCYGPRLIVPALPFLMLPFSNALDWLKSRPRLRLFAFAALAISVGINLLSVLPYWHASLKHPVIAVFDYLAKVT